ncbi:MAG: branched-chain amino acid aminotransferase, partial [Bacteroides cellulosilyticus]|nr:branched-chain amino acid aminotransferase [Bacteroides cellulosilyticus]
MTGFYLYQTLHLLRGRVRLLDRHAALLDRCARELFGTGYAPDLRDLERRVLDTAAARRYPTDLSAFVRLELAADGTERLVPAGVSYYEGYALRSVRPDGVTVVCAPPLNGYPTPARE